MVKSIIIGCVLFTIGYVLGVITTVLFHASMRIIKVVFGRKLR